MGRKKLCIKALLFLKIKIKPIFDYLLIGYGAFQILFAFSIDYLKLQFTFEDIIFYYLIIPWLIILSVTMVINIFGSFFFLSRRLKSKIALNDFFDYCDDYIPLGTNINSLKGKMIIDNIISEYLISDNKNNKLLNKIIRDELIFFEKIKSILYNIYKKK